MLLRYHGLIPSICEAQSDRDTQIEDDPLNAVYESQQNQWVGFAIKYGILPLNPTFLPLKLTQGARGWTVGSDSG